MPTEPRPLRVERQHLDDAAERVRAVEIAGGAANDLDAVDRRERNAIPVHPAAEGSLSAQPSATTSVRLAPEPETPRSVTPCVVGFATRDDERRNRLKPGVFRSASSTAPAADVRSSADDTIVELAAVSTPVAPRDAVTVTDSVSGRGYSMIRSVDSPD